MHRMRRWLSRVLSESITTPAVTFLTGVLITSVAFLLSSDLSNLLRAQVTTSVALLLVFAFLALLGVAAAAERLWSYAAKVHRCIPRRGVDERLEAAHSALLEKLAIVEVGAQFYVDKQMRTFEAELLSLFNESATAVQGYLGEDQVKRIHGIREHIHSRSLNHSTAEAKQWVADIEQISNLARTGIPSPRG